jgi:hypothetical protein
VGFCYDLWAFVSSEPSRERVDIALLFCREDSRADASYLGRTHTSTSPGPHRQGRGGAAVAAARSASLPPPTATAIARPCWGPLGGIAQMKSALCAKCAKDTPPGVLGWGRGAAWPAVPGTGHTVIGTRKRGRYPPCTGRSRANTRRFEAE